MKDWYRLADADCPAEGSDAGDASEWSTERSRRRIQSTRRAARQSFEHSKRRLTNNPGQAEESARTALQLGAHAYWYAENTPLAEREHRTLHGMGRWTEATFGCWLTNESGKYLNRCPVAIADVRLGLSPGFVARKMCSICTHDLSECAHSKGRLYWVRGVRHDDGRCAVCASERCEHQPDRIYRTGVIGIIKQIDEVHEVSLVDVPAQPLARLTERPVDMEDLVAQSDGRFVPGMNVRCTRCAGSYPGLPKSRTGALT